jgi:hypothetical protein
LQSYSDAVPSEPVNKVPASLAPELAALAARQDADIDFSDVPATTVLDWHGAVRGRFHRPAAPPLPPDPEPNPPG